MGEARDDIDRFLASFHERGGPGSSFVITARQRHNCQQC
jgi:hypothetical protein